MKKNIHILWENDIYLHQLHTSKKGCLSGKESIIIFSLKYVERLQDQIFACNGRTLQLSKRTPNWLSV